ncbi:uncharacterized protein LOC129600501 [Paramacrobiotus metropolitanus]|uniref:uncharacterized protein LOC129600501 n=1 Tax=Paramacrobiotus metropolitanus TaxID=2943436 RepID=UPI002445F053|nr:uncharacterized protein LOC129600501 [Paramacrobiotus metropolitanus]
MLALFSDNNCSRNARNNSFFSLCCCCILFSCVWAARHRSEACSLMRKITTVAAVTSPTTTFSDADLNLDDIIQRSGDTREDDRISLKFPEHDKRATSKSSATEEHIYRPRTGANLILTCEASIGGAKDISWTHQGIPIFHKGQRLVDDGTNNQFYNATHWGRVAILGILNVSLQSGGEVVCVEESADLGFKRVVPLKRFTVHVKVTRANEIFSRNMKEVSVNEGEFFNVTCHVRLPLPQSTVKNIRNSVMWRLNGETRWAPSEEPYGTYYARKRPYIAPLTEQLYRSNSTDVQTEFVAVMLFNFLTATESGTIECWFRPDGVSHEWIMQSIRLIVKAGRSQNL